MTLSQSKDHKSVVNVAGTLIIEAESFVIVQEKNKEFYGKWNLPAGRCEMNESPEDTAVRETKEETNLIVNLQGLLGRYTEIKTDNTKVVKHIYKAEATSGYLSVTDINILDVKWITFDDFLEMGNDELRTQDLKTMIYDYLKQREPMNS